MGSILTTFISMLPQMCAGIICSFAITLIFKSSYTQNFSQAVISALGAFVAVDLSYRQGLPLWATSLMGIVLAFVIGLLIDVVIFRNGRYVNILGKQIITMGLISIFVGIIPLVFDGLISLVGVPTMPFISDGVYLWENGPYLPYNTLVDIAITVVVLALVFLALRYTKWGLSVRSTASNETVAGMMGINTRMVTATSWGIAAALGALSAIIFIGAIPLSSGWYYVMVDTQMNAFMAGVLGGFATFYGPVLGAVIIYILNVFISCLSYIPSMDWISTWRLAFVYIIALLIVLWKPQGLFGKKMVKKV